MLSFKQFIMEDYSSILAKHGFSPTSSEKDSTEYQNTKGHKITIHNKPPPYVQLGNRNKKNHDWEHFKRSPNGELIPKSGQGAESLEHLLSGTKPPASPKIDYAFGKDWGKKAAMPDSNGKYNKIK